MNNIEEVTKIGKETRFAVLGREAADRHRAGKDVSPILAELAILRHQEQQVTDREIAIAGLARQLGDAQGKGRDTVDLLDRIAALRERELGG
jgi:hypothetical protein